MPLGWNEIRHRAIKFANENSKAASEAGEKQTYWNEFFEVFGIARKTVASFEAPVKKLTGHDGAIVARQFLYGCFEGGNGFARNAEDFEEFVPVGLLLTSLAR